MQGTRAQTFTLEGVLAALVVLAGVGFALQAAVLSPGAGGATAEPVDEADLDSVVTHAAQNGSLKRAVLFWNSGFHGASAEEFYTSSLDTLGNEPTFLRTLDTALDDTLGVNVVVSYRDSAGDRQRQRMVYQGSPGETSVRAATTLTLYDDDVLYDSVEQPTSTTVAPSVFYAEDASPGTNVYAVVEVEVVVWQT